MPNSLARTGASRASMQATATLETKNGVVRRTYADGLGNVTACDVRQAGQWTDLIAVPNRTNLRLAYGDTVTLNFLGGSRHQPQITGAGGATTTENAAQNSAADSASSQPPPMPDSLTTAPVIVQSASNAAPGGYVAQAGANILLTFAPPTQASGGIVPGSATWSALIPRVGSLPNPVLTTLPLGTIYEYFPGSGPSQGLWRLDSYTAPGWSNIAAGPGSGGGISAPVSLGVTSQTSVIWTHGLGYYPNPYGIGKADADTGTAIHWAPWLTVDGMIVTHQSANQLTAAFPGAWTGTLYAK